MISAKIKFEMGQMAHRFVRLLAEITVQTSSIDPLHTGMVTDLEIITNKRALGNDDASTFVATNERQLSRNGPVTINSVEICVAHTREFDVHEHFIWTWLLNWNLLELDWSAGLLDDLRPLLLWDVLSHCEVFSMRAY